MKHYKKIITSLLVVIFIFTGTRAYAMGPVFDLTNLPFNIGSFLEETMNQVNSFEQTLKDLGLDKVAFMVAQSTSQKLTSSITNSLNGGASGDETQQFIKDFGKHFENIAFQEGQKYVDDLFADTNNPFSSQIGSSFVSSFSSQGKSALDNFSLGNILGAEGDIDSGDVQSKIEQFGNDASIGGYSGLFALGFPENTPIGSSMIAEEELANKISSAKETAKTELTSSGFTGKKDCGEEQSGLSYGQEDVSTETPPADCEIKSPAGLTQDSGNIALSESFNRLQSVDELGELVSSSLTQITSSLVSKGLKELGTMDLASQRNTTYGGARDVSQYFGTNGQTQGQTFPAIIIDFGKELNPAIENTREELAILEETLEKFRSSPQLAHDLDTCTPGPDSGWANRLDKYYTKKIEGIIEKASKDEDATDEQEALDWMDPRFNRSIQETKEFMANPYLNLPGAAEARIKLDTYSEKAKQFQRVFSQVIAKRSSLNSLLSIAANAKASDPLLKLTYEDWAGLDQQTKEILYTESLSSFPQSSLPADDPATIVNERDITLRDRVLIHQWDKWEESRNATEATKKSKNDLFLKFNELRGSISSDASYARAKAFLGEIEQDQEDIRVILGQCLLVRKLLKVLPDDPGSDFTQVSINYQPTTELTTYDNTPIRTTNLGLARQLTTTLASGNYTVDQLQPLVLQLAPLFPDFKTTIQTLFLSPSVLSKVFEPNQQGFNTNSYGDALQVSPAITAEQVIEQDLDGKLFCRLPLTFRQINQNFDSNNDGVVGAKPIFCSEPEALGILNTVADIANPFTSMQTIFGFLTGGNSQNQNNNSVDPISQNMDNFRANFLKNPGVWYFSNGLEDYIFFDKTSVGSSI